MPKLTDRQARFCQEYLIDLNGTQAAIRAGYSAKMAGRIAGQNLDKPAVKEYLAKLKSKAAKKLEITHDQVLHQLKTWAESDITETMCLSADEIKELPIEIRRLITKFKRTVVTTKQGDTIETIELTFVSKEKAIDMINKHIGFYELDNKQKKPEIDVSKLGSDVIKSLLDASR